MVTNKTLQWWGCAQFQEWLLGNKLSTQINAFVLASWGTQMVMMLIVSYVSYNNAHQLNKLERNRINVETKYMVNHGSKKLIQQLSQEALVSNTGSKMTLKSLLTWLSLLPLRVQETLNSNNVASNLKRACLCSPSKWAVNVLWGKISRPRYIKLVWQVMESMDHPAPPSNLGWCRTEGRWYQSHVKPSDIAIPE